MVAKVERGADISKCGRYRYLLWRVWGPGRRLAFVMLNPSTADAIEDDPTIRRCMGFARDLGFDGIEIANLFAWRATNPKDLFGVHAPVGPRNDDALRSVSCCSMVIAAWGAHAAARLQAEHVLERLTKAGSDVHVLRMTKDGHPSHPLYLPASCTPELWRSRRG